MSFEYQGWEREHFGGAQLSDLRRVRRVVTLASALSENPGCSIPELFERPYDIKAAYNLFKHPEATPDSLQAGHRDLVRDRMREPVTTLLLEDTSEFIWRNGEPIEGLGPVGPGSEFKQGFMLHSVLAVRWAEPFSAQTGERRPPLSILGIANQQYYVREPIPDGENGNGSRHRMKRQRESRLWLESGEQLGPAPDGSRWVRICDRGADIYEFLLSCQDLNHGFVVRAAQDRGVVGTTIRLFEHARALPSLGGFTLSLRARPQHPARVAALSVSAAEVTLRSPQRPGASKGGLAPITCTVVRVWEEQPPEGVEPLEWILLTDQSVETLETALVCAQQYATRWTIEEFHKALKTGLGAERLQLESAHRLFAAISIMSVVALRLVALKERVRVMPDAPAGESGLGPLEIRVLALKLNRELKTVRDVALAIGRLGGHMNRKGDGLPGLITLWRGAQKLQALVAGAMLGLKLRDLGNA